jgi:hypothetical protein
MIMTEASTWPVKSKPYRHPAANRLFAPDWRTGRGFPAFGTGKTLLLWSKTKLF